MHKSLKFEMWRASITNRLLDKERTEENVKREGSAKTEGDVKNMRKM